MKERKIGTTLRLTPDVVRFDVPLREADHLGQIGREFEALGFKLRAISQAEHLNDNGKLADAYHALRAFNAKLRKEYPR